ncbi:hypothetical protein COTS27_00014 [Spirochaetota bacterium]|nr:hypothetical protein COTS27_00014 [Spirochaetota bacterium]
MENIKILVATVMFLFITPIIVGIGVILVRNTDFRGEKLVYMGLGSVLALLLINFTSVLRRIYIFFHEVAHMIAAVCFSARIFEFRVRESSGYIKSDKNNIFIRLAPYLLPIICYILLFIYYNVMIYMRYYHDHREGYSIFFFLIGLFYVVTTVYNVKLIVQETSDIEKNEVMLSFLIILNIYFLTSTALFYLLFNGEVVLDKIYFL